MDGDFMKKIFAFFLVMTMAIALLPSISAPIFIQIVEEHPGAPIITDYCIPDYYSIGTFSLARSQTATFNIPLTACPSLKKGPLWGIRGFSTSIGQITNIGIDADAAVLDMDDNTQYNCYYKKPCDCIIIPGDNQIVTNDVQDGLCFPRELRICANTNEEFDVQFFTNEGQYLVDDLFIYEYQTDGHWCAIFELPPEIVKVIITNDNENSVQGEVSVYECCCYDCYKQKALPTTLYPKIDIETFSVPGGATVIKDGKVISKFEIVPGSQQVFLQVENRGFFTQNDTRLRFDGLPEGVTVEVTPETQKIKAHNIASYSANFTVGANVPSGNYQITMVSYSPNGMFDKITFEFVVQ